MSAERRFERLIDRAIAVLIYPITALRERGHAWGAAERPLDTAETPSGAVTEETCLTGITGEELIHKAITVIVETVTAEFAHLISEWRRRVGPPTFSPLAPWRSRCTDPKSTSDRRSELFIDEAITVVVEAIAALRHRLKDRFAAQEAS